MAPALRRDYFALPDDPDWLKAENVVKKLDWCLSVPNALEYNLVTRVLD